MSAIEVPPWPRIPPTLVRVRVRVSVTVRVRMRVRVRVTSPNSNQVGGPPRWYWR